MGANTDGLRLWCAIPNLIRDWSWWCYVTSTIQRRWNWSGSSFSSYFEEILHPYELFTKQMANDYFNNRILQKIQNGKKILQNWVKKLTWSVVALVCTFRLHRKNKLLKTSILFIIALTQRKASSRMYPGGCYWMTITIKFSRTATNVTNTDVD